jgi:hypothetical protein
MILFGVFNEETISTQSTKQVMFSLQSSFIAELPIGIRMFGKVAYKDDKYMVYETKA